jgi:hypothetical protein
VASVWRVAVCTNQHPLLYRHCHRVSSVRLHSLLPAVETVRLQLALSRLRRAERRLAAACAPIACRSACSTRCRCVCCCCCCLQLATTADVLCAAFWDPPPRFSAAQAVLGL